MTTARIVHPGTATQAAGLMRGTRAGQRSAPSPALAPAVVPLPALAVTGGKGGVGKTCVAVNLSIVLAQLGLKPLLVDLDLGLANADILFGLSPSRGLADALTRTQALRPDQLITATGSGVDLLPAASGRDDLAELDDATRQKLFAELARLAPAYDLLVLDTPAGIHRTVIAALAASRIVLIVITPDPTSLTDAYALIKVLEAAHPGKDLRVLVNQAGSLAEAQTAYARLRSVVTTYLTRDLAFLGHLPRERAMTDAVRARRPLALNRGTSHLLQSLRALGLRLKGEAWR